MDAKEKNLILAAQEGDLRAFEKIVSMYKSKVYNMALTLTKNETEAEELAQQVFIKLWRNIGKFKFQSSFFTWFFSLIHRKYIDYIRYRKSREGYIVPIDDFRSLESSSKDVFDHLQEDEQRQILYGVLERIPVKFRMVLIYYDLQGMSYNDIAQITRKPIGTVKSRLNRARKMLKDFRNILGV